MTISINLGKVGQFIKTKNKLALASNQILAIVPGPAVPDSFTTPIEAVPLTNTPTAGGAYEYAAFVTTAGDYTAVICEKNGSTITEDTSDNGGHASLGSDNQTELFTYAIINPIEQSNPDGDPATFDGVYQIPILVDTNIDGIYLTLYRKSSDTATATTDSSGTIISVVDSSAIGATPITTNALFADSSKGGYRQIAQGFTIPVPAEGEEASPLTIEDKEADLPELNEYGIYILTAQLKTGSAATAGSPEVVVAIGVTAKVTTAVRILPVESKDLYTINTLSSLIASQNSAPTKAVNNKQIGGSVMEANDAKKFKIDVVVKRYKTTSSNSTNYVADGEDVEIFTSEFDAFTDDSSESVTYYPRISLTGKLTFSDTPESNS